MSTVSARQEKLDAIMARVDEARTWANAAWGRRCAIKDRLELEELILARANTVEAYADFVRVKYLYETARKEYEALAAVVAGALAAWHLENNRRPE